MSFIVVGECVEAQPRVPCTLKGALAFDGLAAVGCLAIGIMAILRVPGPVGSLSTRAIRTCFALPPSIILIDVLAYRRRLAPKGSVDTTVYTPSPEHQRNMHKLEKKQRRALKKGIALQKKNNALVKRANDTIEGQIAEAKMRDIQKKIDRMRRHKGEDWKLWKSLGKTDKDLPKTVDDYLCWKLSCLPGAEDAGLDARLSVYVDLDVEKRIDCALSFAWSGSRYSLANLTSVHFLSEQEALMKMCLRALEEDVGEELERCAASLKNAVMTSGLSPEELFSPVDDRVHDLSEIPPVPTEIPKTA